MTTHFPPTGGHRARGHSPMPRPTDSPNLGMPICERTEDS